MPGVPEMTTRKKNYKAADVHHLRDRSRGLRPPDAVKSFAQSVAYCGLAAGLRAFPAIRRGGDYALGLLVPAGTVDVYKEVVRYALQARERWSSDVCVVALDDVDPRRRSAREKDVKDALEGFSQAVIVAADREHVPAAQRLMLDGWAEPTAPSARHVQAAVRFFLGLPGLPEEAAEEIAGLPFDALVAFRRGRRWQDSLARAREAVSAKDSKVGGLTLDTLQGMGEAGDWGRELAIDLEDWRAGRIQWSDVDRGILLSGPPGTGKTTFAGALARSCGAHLVTGSLSRWQSRGHLGDLLKAMYGAFAEAKQNAPSILFIDEIDAVGDRAKFRGDSAQYCTEVVNGMLECLDGLDGREGVVVVGACNHPERLDPAIIRPGRLDRHVRIDLPDADGRLGILRWHTNDSLPDGDLREVAAVTEGASGALLEQLVRQARRSARRARREMRLGDLIEQLPARLPVPPETLWRTCVHEAGHAVVGLTLGHWPLEQVVVSNTLRDDALPERAGGVWWNEAGMLSLTQPVYLDRLARLLGGMAAEELVLGAAADGSGGTVRSDLYSATMTAACMEASVGLGAGMAYLAPADEEQLMVLVREDLHVRMRVDKVLDRAKARARDILSERRAEHLRLAEALRDRQRLTGAEVREIVEGQPRLALVPRAAS